MKMLGGFIAEAGYQVDRVRIYTHAWPPIWQQLGRIYRSGCLINSAFLWQVSIPVAHFGSSADCDSNSAIKV
jgi:6-phosphogluconate dehydrogenase